MEINATKLTLLLDVAQKAIKVDELGGLKRQEAVDLTQAYCVFKERHGIVEQIDRDTETFHRMQAATKGEYAAVQDAKRKFNNAQSRLRTAIQRYRTA
jgi:hypothetical protein